MQYIYLYYYNTMNLINKINVINQNYYLGAFENLPWRNKGPNPYFNQIYFLLVSDYAV